MSKKAQASNPETGEITEITYRPGAPKQYRFNGQNGRFNIDGERDAGTELTFQPVAWRIFDDTLFARPGVDKWAEFFFVDVQGCLSSIMFNNSSVTELASLELKLFYAKTKLSEVVLTIRPERKTNDKGTWYLAKFSYKPAPAEAVEMLQDFAIKNPIFRADTVTPSATYRLVSDTYALAEARRIAHVEASFATAALPGAMEIEAKQAA